MGAVIGVNGLAVDAERHSNILLSLLDLLLLLRY